MENLLKYHGQRFSAKIEGVRCEGRICVQDNDAFLCQNKKNGTLCEEKFEYKYSWVVGDGSKLGLSSHDVTDFKLLSSPEIISDWHFWDEGDKLISDDTIYTIIFRHNELFVLATPSNSASFNYTGKELVNLKYKLYVSEEEKETPVSKPSSKSVTEKKKRGPKNPRLNKCHGRIFTATICGTKVEGKILVEGGNVYLCNDEHGLLHKGLGYMRSHHIGHGLYRELKFYHVENFVLLPEGTKGEELKKETPIMKACDNLLGFDGRKFKAKIMGVKVEGHIRVEGENAYLCQDKKDGDRCKDKLGYKYSWNVLKGSENDLKRTEVYDFELLPVEEEELTSITYIDDITKYEGCKFTADIQRKFVEGRIHIEDGQVFLCQNNHNGCDCKDKLGYTYSWSAGSSTKHNFNTSTIDNFQLFIPASSLKDTDLLECDGREFSATIHGVDVTGKISVNGRMVYLCQNKKDGASAPNKYGYKYSWHVRTGDASGIKNEGVTNFKLLKPKTNDKK